MLSDYAVVSGLGGGLLWGRGDAPAKAVGMHLYGSVFSTSTGRRSDQYCFVMRPVLVGIGDHYWSYRGPVLVRFASHDSFL